jgi:hypothetical protein
MVPAVAVNPADMDPGATFTEAGTDSSALLLESATVSPPAPASCDRVTTQAVVPFELRVVGAQDNWLIAVGATNKMEAVCELPP